MDKKVINVERDFSRYPAGRYVTDGPHSGERFRTEFLVPALAEKTDGVVIELDGARGLGSSFLEESFGGLVRLGYPSQEVLERIELRSEDASLLEEIKSYILEASQVGRH
jgi:hypothetical protein